MCVGHRIRELIGIAVGLPPGSLSKLSLRNDYIRFGINATHMGYRCTVVGGFDIQEAAAVI